MKKLDCTRGITLNSQLTDLLSIIDMDIPISEQDERIVSYISGLKSRQTGYLEAASRGTAAKYEYIVSTILSANLELSPESREKLKDIYLENIGNICDTESMQQLLVENGFDAGIHTTVLKDFRNMDMEAKEGILDLTPEKVRALHGHMFKDGANTYDRVTFDNAGKYSSYVSIDGRTYADERLEGMISFCERNGMQSKINTLIMYCDFPKQLETHLQGRVANGEITDEEMRQTLKQSLIDYVTHIGETYGDRIDTVDIFNELIYDPHMSESGFAEQPGYHLRTEGWQKYLDVRDLCEVALEARRVMPETTFTYNDMNWIEPEKREEILRVIAQIQGIEAEFIEQGKLQEGHRLIDTIGFEAHLTTGVNPERIEDAFSEVITKTGLPIEITELDCARTGQNPQSREEIEKQKRIFATVFEMAEKYDAKALTIWSQSDELSFMNEKCGRNVYASLLDENFVEKDIEVIERPSLWSRAKDAFNRVRMNLSEKMRALFGPSNDEPIALPSVDESQFFEQLQAATMPPDKINEVSEREETQKTRDIGVI